MVVVVGVRQLNARQAAPRAHEVWRWSKVLRVAKLFTGALLLVDRP